MFWARSAASVGCVRRSSVVPVVLSGPGSVTEVFGHAGKSVLMLASCGSESPSTTMKRGVDGAQLSESSWNAS